MGSIYKYSKSQWLKKDDVMALSPVARRTRVERVTEEEVGEDMRYVAYFAGIEKGWPLNQTALFELEAITGSEDTDNFAGAAVEIYVDPSVTYQNKRVGGIKLRPLAPTTAKAAPARTVKARPADEEFDSQAATATDEVGL